MKVRYLFGILFILALSVIVLVDDVAAIEVKCTREYCDQTLGQGYYCDPNSGCLKIEVKNPCPTGSCCREGGTGLDNFQVSDCPAGFQCCYGATNNFFRGLCKTSCIATPLPNCNEDPTNPYCGHCLVNGVDQKLSGKDCCGAQGVGCETTTDGSVLSNQSGYILPALIIALAIVIAGVIIGWFASRRKK